MTWWTSQRSSVIFRIFTQVVRGFFVVPCSTHPWSNWPWPLPAQSFSTCVWGEDSTHYPVQGEWKLRVSYGMTKVWPIDANNHGDIIIPRRNGQWGPLKPRDWWPFFAEKNPPYATRFCTSRLIWVPPKNPRICFWGHIQNAFSTWNRPLLWLLAVPDPLFRIWCPRCVALACHDMWLLHPSMVAEVDMDFILGIEAFNLDKILEMDDAFLEALFLEFQKIVIFGYIYIWKTVLAISS